ncbi:hypothetical protein [Streptomyces sp. enrichment culture]|uniref:hypothetical protein n=1 Tax=Streptomyces sp. enrichment culture TaxID=1795815 RepID=UPI003F57C179
MSLVEKHITAVMRQVASQDVVELDHPYAKAQTVASLAYIAEAYGFRYADARLEGDPQHKSLHVYLVRDDDDRARQRAAANAAAFPQAGAGGAVPGMRPGTLTPLPEAEAEVDLLRALIRFDTAGAAGDPKKFLTMSWAIPLVLVPLGVLTGKHLVLFPLAAALPVLLLVALRINVRKRAKLAERLEAAGCTPVRDQQGRERYVRPVPHDA